VQVLAIGATLGNVREQIVELRGVIFYSVSQNYLAVP